MLIITASRLDGTDGGSDALLENTTTTTTTTATNTTHRGVSSLRSKIKQLGEENERLTEKVERARAQVTALPHAAAYTDLCTALRQQHDDEVAISTTLAAQAGAYERAEAAHARAMAALTKASTGAAAGRGGDDEDGAAGMVAWLRDEVGQLRQQVDEQQPQEIEARQRRLAALHEALSIEVGGEAGLQRLAGQVSAMQQGVGEASARLAAAERARQADRAYLQVRQAQQMAAMAAKRRSELEARLERLALAREALLAALGAAEERKGAAGVRVGGHATGGWVSDDDWKVKYEAVRGQLAQFKTAKKVGCCCWFEGHWYPLS